jgi:hypothetical protein
VSRTGGRDHREEHMEQTRPLQRRDISDQHSPRVLHNASDTHAGIRDQRPVRDVLSYEVDQVLGGDSTGRAGENGLNSVAVCVSFCRQDPFGPMIAAAFSGVRGPPI